jgi:hypothetical protein
LSHGKIDERWQERRLKSLSEYVTSVMRYDLLLGGQHKHFPHNDYDPEVLGALDRETLTEFLRNRKPKIRLDFLLEEVAGKELTREKCEVLQRAIGRRLGSWRLKTFCRPETGKRE